MANKSNGKLIESIAINTVGAMHTLHDIISKRLPMFDLDHRVQHYKFSTGLAGAVAGVSLLIATTAGFELTKLAIGSALATGGLYYQMHRLNTSVDSRYATIGKQKDTVDVTMEFTPPPTPVEVVAPPTPVEVATPPPPPPEPEVVAPPKPVEEDILPVVDLDNLASQGKTVEYSYEDLIGEDETPSQPEPVKTNRLRRVRQGGNNNV